jgi:hypothetical protein
MWFTGSVGSDPACELQKVIDASQPAFGLVDVATM